MNISNKRFNTIESLITLLKKLNVKKFNTNEKNHIIVNETLANSFVHINDIEKISLEGDEFYDVVPKVLSTGFIVNKPMIFMQESLATRLFKSTLPKLVNYRIEYLEKTAAKSALIKKMIKDVI